MSLRRYIHFKLSGVFPYWSRYDLDLSYYSHSHENPRKFEVGIYLSYDPDCHMKYFYQSYTCHMTGMLQVDSHVPIIYRSHDRYMTNRWLYTNHIPVIWQVNVRYISKLVLCCRLSGSAAGPARSHPPEMQDEKRWIKTATSIHLYPMRLWRPF